MVLLHVQPESVPCVNGISDYALLTHGHVSGYRATFGR